MRQTKLIALLRTLKKQEWKSFSDFAASPYFNKNQELCRFYGSLKPLASVGFADEMLDRRSVWAALYPENEYDEKALNHLASQLTKLLERFLGQRQFESDGIRQKLCQLEAHLERGLDKGFRFLYTQCILRPGQAPSGPVSGLRQAFELAGLEEKAYSNQGLRKFNIHLQVASDRFDEYFLSQKLIFLCALLDQQKQFPGQYNIAMLPEIRSILATRNYDHIPLIATYSRLLGMLVEPEDHRHFQEFQALLSRNKDQFGVQDATDLYLHAINYCIQRVRYGQSGFAETLLNLYAEALGDGYLLQDGNISPWTYKNVIKLGLGLNQFERVEQFIHDYTGKLPENQKEGAFQFNMADLNYHRQAYKEALQRLNNVEFNDIHYKLGARVILCKIYYETGETEALSSLLSSFRIFLLRSKDISRQVKEPYLNFISIVGRLQNNNPASKEKLEARIRKTAMLSNRNWLLRQIRAAN